MPRLTRTWPDDPDVRSRWKACVIGRSSTRRRAVRHRLLAAAACAAIIAPVPAQGQTIEEVVGRLDRYLVEYEPKLSAVVAEEQYEQWVSVPFRPDVTRSLRSEFVFTRLPGGAPWTGFRDTLVVDGRPIRERDARLQDLLSNGSDDALERAARIVEENARYNLGDWLARRTINTPTLTLDFLHPRHRAQVSFRKGGEATIDGLRLWQIDFVERPPFMIRTPAGGSQQTGGSVWVDPRTGVIVRTFLNVVISRDRDAKITVEYRDEPKLGFAVPREMRESYRPRVEGRARYSGFRRFDTSARILDR